jgi:hypothetical protein
MKKLSYMHTAFTWNCICTNNHNTFYLFPQSHCTRLGIKLSSTTLQLYRWCTKTLDTSELWGPVRYWRCPTSSIFSNKCLIVIEYHVEKLLFRVSNCSSVVIVCSQSKPSWVPTVRCSMFTILMFLFVVLGHCALLCMLVKNTNVFSWCLKSWIREIIYNIVMVIYVFGG